MRSNKMNHIATTAVLLFFFTAVSLICSQVYLYGDDFFYSSFSKGGFWHYISKNIEHYRIANGRAIVHALASMLLGINLWVWRVLNAAALTACAILTLRIAKPTSRALPFCALTVCALLLFLDPQITRQSIYWLTGSLNYLYPMLMLLLYWRILERVLSGKWSAVLLPVAAFFASATTEQGSIMCFGLTLLLLLREKFLVKQKIHVSHILALVFSLLGVLSVVCAPGVLNRVEVTSRPVPGGLLQLVLYNIRHQSKIFFFADYAKPIHIALLLFSIFSLSVPAKTSGTLFRKVLAVTGFLGGITTLLCYLWLPSGIADLPENAITIRMFLYMLCLVFGYVFTLFCSAYLELAEKMDATCLIALILGFGSQLVMLVSPVYGPRVLISFIFMALLVCAKACSNIYHNGIVSLWGSVICFLTGYPYLLALSVPPLFLCHTIHEKRRQAYLTVGAVPLIVMAILSWSSTYQGYAENARIYEKNLAAMEAFRAHPTPELHQTKLPDDRYAWVMPYHTDYYKPYYTICYDITQQTTLIWNSSTEK